jgi:hypothetical protein
MHRVEGPAVGNWLFLPVIMGALVPIGVSRGPFEAGFGVSVAATFLLLVPAATFAAVKLKSNRLFAAILMFGGLAAGVVVDVVIDLVFFAIDRNLFPFEVMYWWLLGAIPIALGFVGGHLLTRKAKANGESS